MEVRMDTVQFFKQNKEYVLDYLQKRGIKSEKLSHFISEKPFGLLCDAVFMFKNEEYEITHFLSNSDIVGYDIRKVNEMLNTDETNECVFAVIMGDDVLGYNIKTEEVFIWYVQTGDGEKTVIADNLDKFLTELNID